MSYVRKTYGEYELQANYGHGYKCITPESTRSAARAQLKTYRDNGDHAPMRIVCKRVKLVPATT